MSSSDKLHLLLDSSYLLPILGVMVEGVEDTLRLLRDLRLERRLVIYYTPFNILEIMGKISKLEYDKEVLQRGLELIREEFNEIEPTIEGYIEAVRLKKKGFKDLIDLLLYTTAKTRKLKLLTRDENLIRFLRENNEPIEPIIIYEKHFIKNHSSKQKPQNKTHNNSNAN